jgi:hypothetical protein
VSTKGEMRKKVQFPLYNSVGEGRREGTVTKRGNMLIRGRVSAHDVHSCPIKISLDSGDTATCFSACTFSLCKYSTSNPRSQ